MSVSLFGWQNEPSVIRIQDKNYVGDAVDNFYARYNEYRGIVPNNYYTSYDGIGYFQTVDSTVRVPGVTKNISVSANFIISNGVLTSNQVRHGQGALGNGRYGTDGGTTLDYMPRLFVVLTPLADFINTVKSDGATQFFLRKFAWGFYDNPPYGFSYVPVTEALLTAPLLNQYVLTYYCIYTNKTDGTEQQAVYGYDTTYNNWGNIPLYDTFIPFQPYSTGHLFDSNPKLLMPYMRQFLSLRTAGFQQQDLYMLGEAGNIGSSDGLLWSGVNQICATTSGDIVNNPFMPYTTMDTGNYPKLTSKPTAKARIITADLSTWKKIFNGSGMPWTDDEDKVKAPDDSGLHKPTFPGMPDNPTGGGDGDGDNISDDIPLPTVSFFPNSNAYNRYWITGANLDDLQAWIFGETFLNDIRRLWTDPAEYLINISYYPFNGYLHDVNNVTQANISIGNLSSDILAFAMGDGYSAKFRGGTFHLTEYFGSYLDYAPYTSVEIYIPYIGYKQLNVNDIMGKTLELIYAVDWDTNTLTATIIADEKPLTMFSGAFGVKLALSGSNANQIAETIAQGIIGTVTTTGMAVAAGVSGNPVGAIAGGVKAAEGALNTMFNVENSPRQFGVPTPATGIYNTQIPHLVIHRPMTAEPLQYSKMLGYSAGYSGLVSGFSGYLKCSAVEIPAIGTITEQEQQEIINLLTGGIYCG